MFTFFNQDYYDVYVIRIRNMWDSYFSNKEKKTVTLELFNAFIYSIKYNYINFIYFKKLIIKLYHIAEKTTKQQWKDESNVKGSNKESNDWKVAATTLTCRHMATKLLCDLGPHGRSDATAHMELVVGVPDFWVLLDRLQQLRTIDERILLRHGHTARAPETEGRRPGTGTGRDAGTSSRTGSRSDFHW